MEAAGSDRKARRWKIVAWAGGCVLALLLIAVIALTAVVHSRRFHNYVLTQVQKQASEAIGTRVQLENFVLNLSNLSLDIYGLTVHGADPYPDPPLLQVAHAEVGVRIVSVLGRKWYLDSVVIDQPVVKVFTDAHGVSNIPVIKSSGSSSSHTSLFDLGIRHAVLTQGAVYYNDRQSVLSADLRNVDFRAAFDSTQQKYSGKLAYSDGHLLSGNFKPISHSLEAQFDATSSTFHLTQAKLTSDSSQLLVTATLENYSHPTVEAKYEARLDGGQFRKMLDNPSVPVGQVRASGDVSYSQVANRSLLDSLIVRGDLTSRQLDVQTPDVRSQIRDVAAHYSLENGNATLKDLRASLLGGELSSSGQMTGIDGAPHSKFIANLHGVQLAEISRALKSAPVPRDIALGGGLNVDATATWGKTLDDLVASADATVHAKVSRNGAAGVPLPLDSAIHGTYTGRNQEIAVRQSYLRTPKSTVTLDGVVSKRSSLGVKFESKDLSELETVAALFRSPAQGSRSSPLAWPGLRCSRVR